MAHRNGPKGNRSVLAARAVVLRAEGLLYREIAAELGVSQTYAQALVTDPDGSQTRARKDSYRRPCPSCGKPMDGSNGRGPNAAKRCVECDNSDRVVWTVEKIVAAFHEFERRYGRQPVATDWMPALAEQMAAKVKDRGRKKAFTDKAHRFYLDGCWPSTETVANRFGSWNNGLLAAGYGLSYRTKRWDKTSIVAAFQRWVAEHGEIPMCYMWKGDTGYPSWPTVVYHFGSWRAGVAATGYQPLPSVKERVWTRERIIDAFQVHARVTGEPPKCADWETSTGEHPHRSTVYALFGGWGNAMVAAGFQPRRIGGDRRVRAAV